MLAAALAAAGIALIAVILVSGDGDDQPVRGVGATATAGPQADDLLDLTYELPDGWEQERRSGALVLTSPRADVRILISAPAAGRDVAGVRAALEQGLLESYAPARITARLSGTVAGRRVRTTEIAGKQPDGDRALRALAVAVAGPSRTYAIQVVSSAAPSAGSMVAAREVLAGMRLSAEG